MKTLTECQDYVQARADGDYYRTAYRQMEADYLPHLCAEVDKLAPGRCVEVGPGWGTMMVYLAIAGWNYLALDRVAAGTYIESDFVSDLRAETCRTVNWESHDIFDGPMPVRADLVIMTQVIPHLKFRPDRAILNAAAMMDVGGTFICTVLDVSEYPHIKTPFARWRDVPEFGKAAATPDMVTVMYSRESLASLMADAFDEVRSWKPDGSTCIFAACQNPKV